MKQQCMRVGAEAGKNVGSATENGNQNPTRIVIARKSSLLGKLCTLGIESESFAGTGLALILRSNIEDELLEDAASANAASHLKRESG